MLTLFFSINTIRLKSKRNSMQAISRDIIPFQFKGIHHRGNRATTELPKIIPYNIY